MRSSNTLFSRIRTVYANRSEPEYAHAFADLYWRTLLSLACIVVIGACVYGALLFSSVLSELAASSPVRASATAAPPFDMTKLNTVLSRFAARQSAFESLQSATAPTVTDPSQSL
jgi:hypothetical protein